MAIESTITPGVQHLPLSFSATTRQLTSGHIFSVFGLLSVLFYSSSSTTKPSWIPILWPQSRFWL